jgi:hypothetical protein
VRIMVATPNPVKHFIHQSGYLFNTKGFSPSKPAAKLELYLGSPHLKQQFHPC